MCWLFVSKVILSIVQIINISSKKKEDKCFSVTCGIDEAGLIYFKNIKKNSFALKKFITFCHIHTQFCRNHDDARARSWRFRLRPFGWDHAGKVYAELEKEVGWVWRWNSLWKFTNIERRRWLNHFYASST